MKSEADRMVTDEAMESRERVILDSINEGVFTVDLNWRVNCFNRAAQRITGVSRQEAFGRPCSEVLRADVCQQACALRRTMSSGLPVVNAMAHIVNHLGQRVPVRLSTALVRDAEGRVVGGVETFQDISQLEELQKQLQGRYSFEDIVGRSASMRKLFAIVPQIAESSSTVLIEGPSGTGKELFARAIHNLSLRRKEPFVVVNCAALPDTLLESELFGHKAGAYTDARSDKPGRFVLADRGTIFLDEIGDISPAMQVRLLRVLQDRIVEPLGAVKPVKVDVRVVAATNKDLGALVREGSFRDDLYYRIRVVQLRLPSLRQRREDIPLLVDHLVGKFTRIMGKNIAGVSEEVLSRLMEYDYPGNVRELENIIEQAFVLCRGELIQIQHLPPELRPYGAAGAGRLQPSSLKAMESHLIAETLQRHHGHRGRAAKELAIDTSTLYRKIKLLGLEPPSSDGRRRRR
jgi:PAS domain S-box-containing protein